MYLLFHTPSANRNHARSVHLVLLWDGFPSYFCQLQLQTYWLQLVYAWPRLSKTTQWFSFMIKIIMCEEITLWSTMSTHWYFTGKNQNIIFAVVVHLVLGFVIRISSSTFFTPLLHCSVFRRRWCGCCCCCCGFYRVYWTKIKILSDRKPFFLKNMVSFASKLAILTDYINQLYVNDNHYHMEYGNIQGVPWNMTFERRLKCHR